MAVSRDFAVTSVRLAAIWEEIVWASDVPVRPDEVTGSETRL